MINNYDNKKVVYTTMVADLFHIGHLRLLQRAKALGDVLIVGILTDDAVEAYKRKPIIPYQQRMEIVAAFDFVDEVIPQYSLYATENLKKIKVDVLTRGNDMLIEQDVEYIESIGGTFVHLPQTKGISNTEISTTEIIKKIKKSFTDKKAVDVNKEL